MVLKDLGYLTVSQINEIMQTLEIEAELKKMFSDIRIDQPASHRLIKDSGVNRNPYPSCTKPKKINTSASGTGFSLTHRAFSIILAI